jgi:hypothetical protein
VTDAELERRDRRLRRFATAVVVDRRRTEAVLDRSYPRAIRLPPLPALRFVLRECARELHRPQDTVTVARDPRRAALERVLGRLLPRERAVLHLFAVAGLDARDASSVLGLGVAETQGFFELASGQLRRALLDESLFGNDVELFDEAVEAHVGYLRRERLEELRLVRAQPSRPRTAIAVSALAFVAAAAGAAFLAARPVAAAVVDETWSCTATAGIQVAAGHGFLHLAPAVQLRDAPVTFALGTPRCRHLRLRIPLGSNAPHSTQVSGSFTAACKPEKVIIFRARITLSHGVAARAEVTVRDERSGRTIAYVDWSPKRITSWLAPGCTAFPV